MKRVFVLGAAALSASLLVSAVARADDARLDDAWKAAMEDNEGILTPAQLAGLHVLAYESAAARLCSELTLDEKKFGASVTEVAKGGDKLTEEEQVQRLAAVMYMLGTSHGLFLAEGSMKKEAFCAEAVKQKADPEYKSNWQ